MKLGIDLSSLSENWGGMQVYTYHFVRSLVQSSQHQLELYAFPDMRQSPVPEAYRVHERTLPGIISSRVLREQMVLPLSIPSTCDRLLVPAYLGPLFTGCPVDLIVYDLLFLRPDSGLSLVPKAYWTGLYRTAFKHADRLFPCSQTTAGQIKKHCPELESKIGPVLYPGLRPLPAARPPRPIPDRTTLSSFILYVGTIAPRKNVKRLITWYLNAPPRVSDRFELRLAGSYGWGELNREQLHQPKKGVHWHGSVSDSELKWLYEHADLLVLPSLGEGFGIPIIEAFAHRLPVLVSDLPIFREVAGNAAFYLVPEDSRGWTEVFLKALTEPVQRHIRVTRGYRRVRKFRWARTARRYLQTLD